jgi:arginyl-tRNA--protein-N-Asp/Glu arginylyltransferase
MREAVTKKLVGEVGRRAGCEEFGGVVGFHLTVQTGDNKLKCMKAKQKRVATPGYRQGVRRVRTAEGGTPTRESRKLLLKAFSHPEGSSERLQVFSKYLNALHDEHAK